MKTWCAVALGCLLVAGAAAATPSAPSADEDYASLVDKLRGGDLDVDFGALRLAFTRTPDYRPQDLTLAQRAREMFAAIKQQKFQEALDIAKEILARNYTHAEAHLGAALAYDKLGNSELSRFHAAVSRGLFNSICPPSGGRTPDVPCVVTSIEEEHFYLTAAGLELQERSEGRCPSGPCDLMKVLPATGEPFTIYFDVSIPTRHWAEQQKTR